MGAEAALEQYTPAEGDYVRVVLEGRVSQDGAYSFIIGDDYEHSNIIFPDGKHVLSVEKVEPAVVTFQPTQTVRHKKYPYLVYSLGFTGYYAHFDGSWYPNDDPKNPALDFTDADYELLEVK